MRFGGVEEKQTMINPYVRRTEGANMGLFAVGRLVWSSRSCHHFFTKRV